MDIKDFDVSRVEGGVFGVAKHLCGEATDLSI